MSRPPGRPIQWLAHGTRSRYIARRCRCQPCRSANATYQRNLRRTKAQLGWCRQ